MGVGVASLVVFSSVVTVPAILISAGTALDWIADAGDVADTCVVNQESVGWCGGTIALAALPFVPSKVTKGIIKNIGDTVSNEQLKKVLDPVKDLISKYFKKLRNSKAIGDEAFEKAIKTADDNIYMAKGADKVLGDVVDIDNLAIVKNGKIRPDDLANGIKDVGKLDDAGVPLTSNYLDKLRKQGDNAGAWAEAKVASQRLEDMDVLGVNKHFNKVEYDIFSRYKGTNKGLIEEVKNGASFDLDDFEKSVGRLKGAKGQIIDGVEIIDTRFTV